jgi:periplasmic protein TonB
MTYRDSYDDDDGARRDWEAGRPHGVPEGAGVDAGRVPFRLATTIPVPAAVRRSRKVGLALSIALHSLIFALLLLPVLLSPTARAIISGGAGGAGPAGGGGGGFGIREGLRYIRVSPAPPASEPTPTPVPPVTPPLKQEVPPPTPQPVQPTPNETPPAQAGTADSGATAAAAGSGGPGAGPGTGGGVGSGVGTGTGTAEGPGTGGGTGEDYPPQPLEVFLPPSPIPSKIRRPYTLVVTFDVDTVGKVLSVDFPGTPDGGYNRRLREIFARMRFRPAVSQQGRPLRRAVTLTYQF